MHAAQPKQRCYNVDLKSVIHDNKQHKCENETVLMGFFALDTGYNGIP